jgi:hypothetical protein
VAPVDLSGPLRLPVDPLGEAGLVL